MGHDMVAPHWEPSCTIHGDDIARSKAGWNLDNGVRSPRLEQLQWEGLGSNRCLGNSYGVVLGKSLKVTELFSSLCKMV